MPAVWGRLPIPLWFADERREGPSFMNIACTACSARYGVADEKLIGKRVKITCKRCRAVLIVDGNVSPPTVSVSTSIAPGPTSARPASSRAPEPAARPAEPPFMVAFADGRREDADVAQIMRWHRAGQLGPLTLVWREGMEEWKNPWDVPEIAAAFRKMGYARPTPAPVPAARPREVEETTRVADSGPQHSALFEDDEATQIVDSSQYHEKPLPRFGSVPGAAEAEDDEAATSIAHSPLSSPQSAPAPARARDAIPTQQRASNRVATGSSTRPLRESSRAMEQARLRESRAQIQREQDLFARRSQAGSEAEQAAQAELSADQSREETADDGPRLTGARNESSVLFSLDSLMQKEQRQAAAARPRRSVRNDEALLVDSNLSIPGGGGITPALSAPDFTAPITSPPPTFSPAPVTMDDYPSSRKRSKGVWIMAALIIVGGVGGVGFATGKLQPLLSKAGLMAPAAPSAAPEPTAPESARDDRAAASAVPETSAVPEPSAAPATSASAAPAPPPTGVATTTATPPPTGAAPIAAAPTGGGAAPRAKDPPKEKEPPPATGFGAGAPFDAQAAKTALGGAAANASSCKEPGGPTGSGRVSITFAASGRPTSVAVTGDLAGTTVGSCVARLFRGARVPAFSGEPVTVSKTFSVE
jgi:predicted Zn finger-like uncharacterized protein